MADRPYTLLSCCVSLDGHLDDAGPRRLILSNDEDLDRVDAVRADCDAILVGANTIRRDNPRLEVKSVGRRAERFALGRPASPIKVTVTRSGRLDAEARFFATGDGERLVYGPADVAGELGRRLGERATVVPMGRDCRLDAVLVDLSDRGVERLMVEGGGSVNAQLVSGGLVDQLDLVVAPVFVGDPSAPRLVEIDGRPWTAGPRAQLVDVRAIGQVVLMRYALSERFEVR